MEAIIDYCLFCSMLNRLLSLNLITNDKYRLLSEMYTKKLKIVQMLVLNWLTN